MVHIERSVLNEMIKAVECQSEECCGFFFGREVSETKVVTKSIAVINSEERNRLVNFKIASMDYLRAEAIAEENKSTLLGIYHSHPNYPATPSRYDCEAAQPYFSYIIISVINQKFDAVRSWQLGPDFQFKEEKIDVT